MICPILIWPNEKLHEHSVDVPEGHDIDQLVLDMFDTMYEAGGVGLAAIQIGIPLRIFVMDVRDTDTVFVNPVISAYTGDRKRTNEGCLSLPGIVEQVERYHKITVTALDRNGKRFTQEYRDMEAQCIQHEVEHLDGVMMPDKFSAAKREMIRLKLKNRKAK